MLKDGSWRQVRFRKYTIALKPARIVARQETSLSGVPRSSQNQAAAWGFEEMRGGLIENESGTWTPLHAAFHPAREP